LYRLAGKGWKELVMRKTCFCLVAVTSLFLLFISFVTGYAKEPGREWVKVSNGIMDADLKEITVSIQDHDNVYITSDKVVYMTGDGGESWSELLSFRTTEKIINTIVLSGDSKTVYVGTTDGLYKGSDRGAKWERIFIGVGRRENAVFAVAVNSQNSEIIILGTMAGIFITEDSGRNWSKGKNLPAQSVVTAITPDGSNHNILYAASSSGVYKSSDRGASWDRIYELTTPEENYHYLFEDEDEDISKIKVVIKIRDILIDPEDYRTIYIATSNGLILSSDGGMSWKSAGSSGLLSRNIRTIIAGSNQALYASTDRGVFKYMKGLNDWQSLSEGLSTIDIRSLDANYQTGNEKMVLWAASRQGLFKTEISSHSSSHGNIDMTAEEALSMFSHEPIVEEIRQAAIEYAEVQPEKINKWRKAAARKAWLPDLRVAYDDSEDLQSSTYFYKDTYQEQYLKDNDITAGNDKGWSVSLSWELGDLIWNSAQTTIDVRSRLMVQLRDDILNEVSRLYFERRRLQIQMITHQTTDFNSSIDNELRLQELTAGIDALTGSYLSKRLGL
jgi:photosystem II stability/assembly factor-like uncharacterized protein